MSFMNDIISWLKDIEGDFYDAYLVVWEWPLGLWRLGYPLLYISRGFGWLAYYFGKFNVWLVWAAGEIDKILSWSNIKSKVREWLPDIENLIAWFSDWWNLILSKLEKWWAPILNFLKGLIAIAVQGLSALIEAWDNFWNITWPEWTGKLSQLRALWDNFWITIFPTLVSFTWLTTWWNSRLEEVNKLINDTIETWFPFYDDLVSIWEEIKGFFASPLDWLEAKFTDWFLGKE